VGHEFSERREAEVPAAPEEIWDAIATGPGTDSWFMGRTEVDPGEGGSVRTIFGGYRPDNTITGWRPGQRLAYGTEPGEDGRFVAYEFLIEGRDSAGTVLRMVTSGFLPGDDWEVEFDAMTKGTDLFFATLVEYVSHFAGRTAVPVTAFGSPVSNWDDAWRRLSARLDIEGVVREGVPVRCTPDALPSIDGIVYFTNPHTLGIRTPDALYRFLQGFGGSMVVGHHLFADDVNAAEAEKAWQHWLARTT
jgi:uncharacterized protein YndB with AHSA1/START domain